MFCNKCGNEISHNQRYCNKCGNYLTYNNVSNITNYNMNDNQSLNKEIMITRDQNQFSNNDIKRNAGSNLALDRTKNINNNLNQPEKPQQISICESSMRGPKQNLKISHVVSETIISKNPVDLCKTLKAAYIYSDMATIDNLIKDGDLFSAMRTSGCFCYYAWMIPSEKYETVKHNFTKWERFKIYLYFIVWLFVKPSKKNVKITSNVLNKKNESVVKNAERIIEQNYLKSKMRENPFEK